MARLYQTKQPLLLLRILHYKTFLKWPWKASDKYRESSVLFDAPPPRVRPGGASSLEERAFGAAVYGVVYLLAMLEMCLQTRLLIGTTPSWCICCPGEGCLEDPGNGVYRRGHGFMGSCDVTSSLDGAHWVLTLDPLRCWWSVNMSLRKPSEKPLVPNMKLGKPTKHIDAWMLSFQVPMDVGLSHLVQPTRRLVGRQHFSG